MNMLLDDLKAFIAVIDHNSLTRAADALSLTQSAVSRRIQHLEESLEASLFDRASKPPKATALAHRIYGHAVPLMREVNALLDVPREDAAPSGMFRLGFTQVVAEVVLFDAVVRMKTDFPALEVQLHTEWSSGLLQQLDAGKLDAATVMLPAPGKPPDSVSGRCIETLEVLVVQSRRRPLVEPCVRIEALARQEWILNPHGCGYRAALERAMQGAGQTLRLSVDTHGTEMQLRLVAAGLGLGLVPASILRKSHSYNELSIVTVPDFALELDVWLVHSRQLGNLKRAAQTLGDAVAECFAGYAANPAEGDAPRAAAATRRKARGAPEPS
jgi:DNA-binding transcriptional LysR family regulator